MRRTFTLQHSVGPRAKMLLPAALLLIPRLAASTLEGRRYLTEGRNLEATLDGKDVRVEISLGAADPSVEKIR